MMALQEVIFCSQDWLVWISFLRKEDLTFENKSSFYCYSNYIQVKRYIVERNSVFPGPRCYIHTSLRQRQRVICSALFFPKANCFGLLWEKKVLVPPKHQLEKNSMWLRWSWFVFGERGFSPLILSYSNFALYKNFEKIIYKEY